MRIGVDIMGSDASPKELYSAVCKAAEEFSSSAVTLVLFTTALFNPAPQEGIEVYLCEDVISMEDHPLHVLRKKKKSTLTLGINELKNSNLDAFVTAGNTGALIAKSTMTLSLLPGVLRPALLALLPSEKGGVAVIDVGGGVQSTAEQLVQFAHLGVAYQSCMNGIANPKVGILNIGVEPSKGSQELQKAYQLLEAESGCFSFEGNVEGRDIFKHVVDVVVTDGFTGNVLLKTAEGVSSFIFDHFHTQFSKESLQQVRKRFDYVEYPGAVLCGLDKLVIKCHGDATELAMLNSIRSAARLVKKDLIHSFQVLCNTSPE